MISEVRIPERLRCMSDGVARVAVSGLTAHDLIGELVRLHPALKPHLLTDMGELLGHVALCVIDDDVRVVHNLDFLVKPGSCIGIISGRPDSDSDPFDITTHAGFIRGELYRRDLVARLRSLSLETDISGPAVAREAAFEIERLERACRDFCTESSTSAPLTSETHTPVSV